MEALFPTRKEAREFAVNPEWDDHVDNLGRNKGTRHGKLVENVLVRRMKAGEITEEAFRGFFPALRFIDETNRGPDSIGSGPGVIGVDGMFPEANVLGGGYLFQVKRSDRDTTEMKGVTGNLSTIAAFLAAVDSDLWRVNGVRIPVLLADASFPDDPRQTRVSGFAVFELTQFIALRRAYAGVTYEDYDWVEDMGIHVRHQSASGRGGAAVAPLRVVWSKSKTGALYGRLVLSLRHKDVAHLIKWVSTSECTDDEAAVMMAKAIKSAAKRR